MLNKQESRPYLNESDVFAQDEHITGSFVENLGLTELATEEQIIEAINKRIKKTLEPSGEVYVAKI